MNSSDSTPATGAPGGPVEASRASKIWRRTQVGGGLACALAALLWGSSLAYGAELVLASGFLLGLWSLFEVQRMGYFPSPGFGGRLGFALVLHAMALFGLLAWLRGSEGAELRAAHYWGFALGAPLAALIIASTTPGLRAAPVRRLWLAPWLVAPLPALALIHLERGPSGLAALMVLSKLGDIAGYYVGNAIGKRRPFPKLSKGKTVAGCVGSLLAGTLAGALCQMAGWLGEPRLALFSGLFFGALLNLAAQAGDLLESYAKRGAGVKDSGSFFGPSGGVLDLVDSLLLTVPTALWLWPLLFR